MPGLVMRKGPSPGVRFPIAEKLILGRHRNADIVVQDPSASRRHAAVIQKKGEYRLLDLGSTNGTFVNGQPLRGDAALKDGDLIQIGEEIFEFVLRDDGSLEPATLPLDHAGEASSLSGPGAAVTLPALGAANGKASRPAGVQQGLPRDLGKFVLLSHLGRGGMGDVFYARERDGGTEVAIKLIRSEIGNRESFLDFFHNREAVLARQIDHPNVIKIYEHGAIGEQHFIAMEYVAGESLQDRMRRGQLSLDEALEVIRQVACGLAAAHRLGVVHSDIKPANIMVLKNTSETPGNGGGAVHDAPVVLEFPDSASEQAPGRYEGALRDEIRRRLGEPPRDLLLDPPYFQRASEMHFLLHYWEGVKEAKGCLILIQGEAGSGKDRLVSEFVKELGLAPPGTIAEGAPAAKLYELDASRIEGIPLLYQRLFPDRPPLEKPTRETVGEILQVLGADGEPVVLRVLSLEEASPLDGELLEGLCTILPQRPILALAVLDTDSPRVGVNAGLRALLARPGGRIKELFLRPLTRYQIGRYLQELFREPVRHDRLANDLYRLTGGNFARLLETLGNFFKQGLLRFDRPAGRVAYQPSQREFELAEGKQLYEKYRKYGKMEQRVLETGAFIGSDFLFDTLHRACEIDETSLFFIVRDLCAQGFITEPSRSWYRFTNLAFQRYLAEKVSAREKPRRHRKVAWILDEAPLGVSPSLLRLRAHHWQEAGEHAKAVRLLLEGAHLARSEYDIDQARQMYQEILRIYRALAYREADRRAVVEELRAWFQRDANWYEVLGGLGEESVRAAVKITDFGISFKVQQEDDFFLDQRPALGTPRYLAPERVRREAVGPKSDIFSLGIILYEMIMGAPPFPGKKGLEVMRANCQREIPTPVVNGQNVPPEFYDLYRGMVEKEPDARWDAERVLRTIAKIQFDARLGS